MTSRDDAIRAAVAPMLADLRSDLLALPAEHVVDQHLDMMAFEQQVLATPRFVQKTARRAMPRPRRALIALLCAFSTLVSCGLSAAGALPAPLQHITESIAHTFGVPRPEHTPPAPHGAAAGASVPGKPAVRVTHPPLKAGGHVTPVAPAKAAPAPPKKAPVSSPPTTTLPVLPGPKTQIATSRPHVPPTRINPVDAGPPPSTNSSNAPPGYPADWRSQATAAAGAQLAWVCAFATTPTQTGCPQDALASGADAQPQSFEWTLLNDPVSGAAVIAKTKPGNPAKHVAPATTITVYAAFQMEATYTKTDGSGPYIAYSSGVGAATMTWNSSGWFENVSFSPGSVAGHLLPGVKAPSIPRPTNTGDGVVLSTVQNGFNACTASVPPAAGPIPTCPQTTAAGEQWTLNGDPAQGAVVSYDSQQGLFTVTGTYAMTSNLGGSAGGPYTATLFFDGTQLQLLSIAAN